MSVTHLVVVVPQADADGAAGPGQHRRHGVQVDEHVCYSLQDELLVHNALEKKKKSGQWLFSPPCHSEQRRSETSFNADHTEQLIKKKTTSLPSDIFDIKGRLFCG